MQNSYSFLLWCHVLFVRSFLWLMYNIYILIISADIIKKLNLRPLQNTYFRKILFSTIVSIGEQIVPYSRFERKVRCESKSNSKRIAHVDISSIQTHSREFIGSKRIAHFDTITLSNKCAAANKSQVYMFIGEIYCAAAETFSLFPPDRMYTASNWQRTQQRMEKSRLSVNALRYIHTHRAHPFHFVGIYQTRQTCLLICVQITRINCEIKNSREFELVLSKFLLQSDRYSVSILN